MIKALRFILISACLSTVSSLQSSVFRFVHYTSKDGLPHQQIEALAFDKNGLLWIGTRNGLSSYDGYDFVNYFNNPKIPNSLPSNSIKTIFRDSKQRIWIGDKNGICVYRPETDDFKCYNLNSLIQTILENSRGQIICGGNQLFIYDEATDKFHMQPRQNAEFIISMAIDKKDQLFVATNRSIFYYDPNFTKTTELNPAYFSDFITGADGIIPMQFDSAGNLWIGRNGKGVMKTNLTTGQTKIYTPDMLSDGTVRVIAEDRSGQIWLGTEGGISIIGTDGLIQNIRQDLADTNGLNDNAIYAIVADKNNNIWIGTYFGGINVLFQDNKQFHWLEPGYGLTNVKGKAIRKIIEPQQGKLWMATEDGGINIYDTQNQTATVDHSIPGIGRNIHCLYFDKASNDLWIGTFRNGLFRHNIQTGSTTRFMPKTAPGLASDAIFDIVKTKKNGGKLWIASTQGLRYYDADTKQFRKTGNHSLDTDFIYTLLVDKDDNLWVGSCNNGLFKIDARTGEISNWSTKDNQSQLHDDYITCLYQDSNSRIWIGTNNNGLRYIDPLDMQIKTPFDGLSLPESCVCSIIEDRQKELWISTGDGLFRFSKERNAMTRYTAEDGLPGSRFTFAASIQAQNGKLYFFTVNGMIFFDPKDVTAKETPITVHIRRLIINNDIITTATPDSPLSDALDNMQGITLSYAQSRSFSIEYGTISPGNTSTINYRVKLDGIDKNWQEVGKIRRFSGLNLAPGTYYLHIKANNTNLGWEKAPMKTLKIVIRPPFYQSAIAYIVYVLLLGAACYAAYRVFAIRLRDKNAVRMANLQKEKTEEVNQAKMEFFTAVSHELKTPLSLIKAPLKYIAQHQPLNDEAKSRLDTAIKNTDRMVGIIDELVTFNRVESGNFQFYIQQGNPLDFIENTAMPFKETAAERKIQFYIHCENNGEEVWFSPLYVERITNNLLSNAIKFTPENGTVVINAKIIEKEDGYTYLRIVVKDSGIGISKDEIDNIFLKYYQTKRGHNMNNKGWGLGLSLVKRFAEIHKGAVAVESEPGKGSRFEVLLNVSASAFDLKGRIGKDTAVVPLEKYQYTVPAIDIAEKRNENGGENQQSTDENKSLLSLLIVEDNEELLKFLADYFAPNYNVFTATNGSKALKIAQKYPIQLVISDVMMPEMDGYTLCSTLKNDISTSHIPVILLTAKNETGDIKKGYESGAEAYVQKPFDPQILELQVSNIINIRRQWSEKIVNATNAPSADDAPASKSPTEEELPAPMNKLDEEFINKINDLIDKNIDNDKISISDITKQMSNSRSLLHVKMKRILNISIGDNIRKKRLNLARQLMHDGFNVSETAYRTGFSDPNYFSKVFKREFGITPTDFISGKTGNADVER